MSEEVDKAILSCLRDIQRVLKKVEYHLEYMSSALTLIEVNSTASLTEEEEKKVDEIFGDEDDDDEE